MCYRDLFRWVTALSLMICAIPVFGAESYSLPPAGTKSLVRELSAVRNSDGTVSVSGVLLLPPGTKLMVTRLTPTGKIGGQSHAVLNSVGVFASEAFSDMGKAPAAGPQKIEVVAMFNSAWQQPPAVIAIVGEDGKKLPVSAVRLNDREFPQQGGHLDEVRVVQFPSAAEDVVAIEHVKNAKLFVQGQGQAVDTVDYIVKFFQKAGGFTPKKWSAAKSGTKWVVTLDCQDAGSAKQAQWEYDPSSKKVRYLDPLAKTLSWLPAK